MRALIGAGIDLYARNNSGHTILHSMINGEQGMLEYLLRQKGGRKIIDVVDNVGHMPLYCAVLLHGREAAKQLVEYRANKSQLGTGRGGKLQSSRLVGVVGSDWLAFLACGLSVLEAIEGKMGKGMLQVTSAFS